MLDVDLKKFLPIVLLALAACGSDAADQARAAAEAARQAAQEHAEAARAAAKDAAEAAQASLAEAAEQLEASREGAKQQASLALQAALRYAVSSKEELDAALGAELAGLDAKRAELAERMQGASEEIQARMGLFVAAADQRRELFETKASQFAKATGDSWRELQPGLEESLTALGEALESASTRFDKTLAEEQPSGPAADWHPAPPRELYEVVKVVDGDTIHIMRNGKKEKLRLLSVDTEEKLSGQPYNASKPETLYGEETKLWAIDLFAALADEDGVSHVGLLFPGGEEQLDIYGRLLCEVILPDGTDYNLQLVKEGRSPYFMKYGYSRICHAAFEAAEAEAREQQLGIWSPDCNKPAAEGEPWHKRDYATLIPWWRARAEGIEAFRQQKKANPDSVVAADDGTGLEAAVERCKLTGYLVSVFGAVDRTFEEDDGSLTLLMRAENDQPAFRAHVPAELRDDYAGLGLEERMDSGRQNYMFAAGTLIRSSRGFDITITDHHSLRLAAPDPELPASPSGE